MQNRSGLRTDPLGTPLVIDGFLFVCFGVFFWVFFCCCCFFFWGGGGSMCHLQVRIVDNPVSKIVRKIYLRCSSCTWIAFSVKISQWTRSKALRKSRNTASDIWRVFKAESQVSVKRVTAVWQECPHRKPDWKEWKSWCLCKKSVKCLWMCLSSGFVRTDRIEIGR